MTKERRTNENSVETDAVVTQVYRDTADERAPQTLNRAILEQAARAARPRYSRLISWTRPMAWAATVMLSVAIVFQLTQVPVPERASFEDDTQAVDAAADNPVERLEEVLRPEAAPGRVSVGVTSEIPKIEALRSTAKQAAANAAVEKRQRSEQSKAVVLEQEAASPDYSVDEFRLKDQELLQRPNDTARMQIGDHREAAPGSELPQTASADVAALGVTSAAFEAPGCDETVTAAVETWLRCIADLEEAGLSDAAREQRELFTAAFPDFDTP